MWSSVAVPAIVAAAVTVAVNATAGRIQQLGTRFIAWVRPDHTTLVGGTFGADNGGFQDFRCFVRCAPARRFSAARLARRLDPVATSALATALSAEIPAVPVSSGTAVARFQPPTQPPSYPAVVTACIWTNGRVEFEIPLKTTGNEDEGVQIRVAEVVEHITALVDQVRHGGYRRVFHTRRRMDWALSVSAYARSDPSGQSIPWAGLTFDGVQPKGRATEARPAQPIPQFGVRRLTNLRARSRPDVIIRRALDDWLFRSEYWSFDGAIEDLVRRAKHSRREGIPSTLDVPPAHVPGTLTK
jgi:hypothetical protein